MAVDAEWRPCRPIGCVIVFAGILFLVPQTGCGNLATDVRKFPSLLADVDDHRRRTTSENVNNNFADDNNADSNRNGNNEERISSRKFNHMAIDQVTGKLYIAGLNRIYRLDTDRMTAIGQISIGPRLDDRRCTESFGLDRCGSGGSTSYPARLTDNVVKVLAIDADRRKLVVCGSVFQGICDLINIDDDGEVDEDDRGPEWTVSFSGVGELTASLPLPVNSNGGRPSRGNTDYFVAANDPDLSTVGFVAPGPSRQSVLYVASTYSGGTTSGSTSFTASGSSSSSMSASLSGAASMPSAAAAAISAVRQAVPAVSSRSLTPGPGSFRFVHVDGLTGGTALRFRSEAVERFSVDYVTGFDGHDGFAYFVAVQPETFEMASAGVLPPTVSADRGSRIIQICQNDRNYYSYVEMPLRCRASSTGGEVNDDIDFADFNIVQAATVARPGAELARQLGIERLDERILVAAFTRGRSTSTSGRRGVTASGVDGRAMSALCVYRMAEIRRRFTQNIQRCFAAEQRHVGIQFGNRMCVSLGMLINETYCGEVEQNGPLVGHIPVEARPVLVLPDVELTAVTVTTAEDQTVAFVGTSDGHLKKIVLTMDGDSHEFGDALVDEGQPIHRDIIMDSSGFHVYAMTDNQVAKVSVSQCEIHTTCDACRSARNPYCGWCSLEKRCSTRSTCLDSHQDKRWLSSNAWECIRIPLQFVNPVSVGIKRSVQVSVGIKALPVLNEGDRYLCVFGANWSVTVGNVSPNEIKCSTPPPQIFLPLFQAHSKDHINVTLSVRSSQTGVDFIDTLLTFYDCSRHSTCSVCTQSAWGCSWCVHRSQCLQTEDTSNCRGPIIKDYELCPRLRHTPGTPEILIPTGVLREIPLSAMNLPPTKSSDRGFECLVHLTAPPLQIPARRESASLVVCEPFVYWYEAEEPQKTASLEVIVNGRYLVEDSYGFTVTVFKCDVMAPDCSTCLSLQEAPHTSKYGCQWCAERCQHNTSCDRILVPMATKCPLPVIETVYPLTGLIDGGIRITIKGLNLGTNFDQIKQSVTVAGVSCQVLAKEYIVSRQIVCKTGPMGKLSQGAVIVTVGDAVVSSDLPFKYQNLRVTGVFPTIGPQAGGTEVTFVGHDLDTGSNTQVLFDYLTCPIDRKRLNSTHFVCVTPSVAGQTVLPIAIRVDDANLELKNEFEFTENPVITKIEPLSAFKSGGRTITVIGTNLNSVQKPVIHVYNSLHRFSSNCVAKNDVMLHCTSPHVTAVHGQRKSVVVRSPTNVGGTGTGIPASMHEFTVGFTMDNVESVRDLPVFFPDVRSSFSVHPDPIYDVFKGGKKIYKGEALILTGAGLNGACDVDEVSVWIGNSSCKVNSLDSHTLYCSPPAVQPSGSSGIGQWDSKALPVVKVVVGNLEFVLGQLEYQKFELSAAARSEYWVIGVAVGGGTLLTVVMVILVVYKRKSTHAQRQFRRLQQQLDSLESNIRNECKQAFAELQTEVIDFTSDLNVIGIPFSDYRSYTSRVFFPTAGDAVDQAIYSDVRLNSNGSSGCCGVINKFYQLLSNECFILCFIRTLDNQQNFSIRQKSKVASLVMTVFHNKLDYVTEILKILLSELIDRSLERRQPKLMLRRTEYIAEKLLTNWLSLCMYGHMKRHVATTMFMLYKAVKHQVEKGPVDAVTFEARYALSEDRLLREKIESKQLTIYLVSELTVQEPVVCRMLDCDTISQAKEKALDALFKNTPFSQRPAVRDIDLELLSPSGGRQVMRDDDASTITVSHNERRLNTLSHYRVSDRATFVLVKARLTLNGYHNDNGKSLTLRKGANFTTSDKKSKYIHLVRHDDGHHLGRDQKVMTEIFLTRLLATKCTLQQYVDDLFTAILQVDGSPPPMVVKYLFDFFDSAARRHGVNDPEVVHTWKSNSLLLRFWVNIIKNPEFVFDVHKSHVVDSCLSVVAQTFMDSCSMQGQRLGKDSPSSKLLYAKDIPRYRQMVLQFYRNVQDSAPVSDSQLCDFLSQYSEANPIDFQIEGGLLDLLKVARQYKFELLEAMDDDSEGRRQQLAVKFEDLLSAIDDEVAC